MNQNAPFIFGKLASGNTFINRVDEIEALKQNFVNGINTILISPRRWGKSSLVEKAAKECDNENKDIKFCFVDMFEIKNEVEFYEKFLEEVLKQSASNIQRWTKYTKEFLKRVIPVFSFGVDPQNDLKIKLEWSQLKRNSREILSLPEKIAEKKNIKFVICIDEFQKVAQLQDGQNFQEKLRAVWQRQNHCSYCLYGSKQHVVNDLFQKQSMPFYRFGTVIYLKKIAINHWPPFIKKGFNKFGKEIDDLNIDRIIEISNNHPYYVQQISYHLWLNCKKKVTQSILEHSINELLMYNEIMYHRDIDSLSSLQFGLLKAIAMSEKKLTSKETVEKYNLGTSGNIGRIINSLVKKELIDVYQTKYEFIDPLFELWFNRRFMV